MRRDYKKFINRDAEVLSIGPENQEAFHDYWEKEKLPFVGLADPDHKVADREVVREHVADPKPVGL